MSLTNNNNKNLIICGIDFPYNRTPCLLFTKFCVSHVDVDQTNEDKLYISKVFMSLLVRIKVTERIRQRPLDIYIYNTVASECCQLALGHEGLCGRTKSKQDSKQSQYVVFFLRFCSQIIIIIRSLFYDNNLKNPAATTDTAAANDNRSLK